jgi:hypothetical protein
LIRTAARHGGAWASGVDEMTMRAEVIRRTMSFMAERVMFVQVKTGHDTDQGPAWISRVRFTKSWKTAYWHGRTLHRRPGLFDANFSDAETHQEYWLSGPHRDQADTRYSTIRPEIDDDVREAYQAFLRGAPLPGRERG